MAEFSIWSIVTLVASRCFLSKESAMETVAFTAWFHKRRFLEKQTNAKYGRLALFCRTPLLGAPQQSDNIQVRSGERRLRSSLARMVLN
jgi:hypothetical protein